MSISICTSCLSRLRLTSRPPPVVASSLFAITSTSFFHSSAVKNANPPKKRTGQVQDNKHRQAKTIRIKKKGRERPKPRPVGELRATRKRIVLSNTNALEVQGMEDLSVQNMSDAANIGKVLGLEGTLLDRLRDAKAFKTTQNWNMFRRPATLIRKETVNLGSEMEDVNSSLQAPEPEKKVLRQIVTGEKSAGKSLLLLQAMAMAYMNSWIVVNVPEAQDFTINRSSYAPLRQKEDSQEQLYTQPHLASDLLSRMAYSNDKILSTLKPNHEQPKTFQVQKNANLKDIALVGAQNPAVAVPVWHHLWKELTQPSGSASNPRPPMLVAIDSIDHWMGLTQYRSSEHKLIHAHQFTLVQQLLSLLFSSDQTQSLAHYGGIILAATTGSNSPSFPSFTVLLRQLAARAAGVPLTSPDFPMPEPYSKADPRVLNLLSPSSTKNNSTTVTTLTGLNKPEAKGLLEYFARSGVLKETITETLVGEKWTLSGSGNVGEMVKLGRRSAYVVEEGVGGTSVGMWPGQGLHRPVK